MTVVGDQILNGVTKVPKLGLPGTIAVYGEKSQAVLTGEEASDVLIAASELGSGRGVFFPQDNYVRKYLEWTKGEADNPDYAQLCANITGWLLMVDIQGDACATVNISPSDVLVISELRQMTEDTLCRTKIMVWDEPDLKNSELLGTMVEFVKKGGALLAGCTPWGFLQRQPGKDITDMPMNQVVNMFGLSFTPFTIGDRDFPVAKNKAHASHVLHALKALDLSSGGVDHNCSVFTKSLPQLPKREIDKIMDQLEKIYRDNKERVHYVPTIQEPVRLPEGKALLAICQLVHRYGNPDDLSLPGIDKFPGLCKTEPQLNDIRISVISPHVDYYATGYYAAPNKQISVEVLSEINEKKPWVVMIGCHTDNIYNCSQYKRWPVINENFPLVKKKTTVSNMFGGSIYLLSPKSSEVEKMELKLSNVVECPYIDTTDAQSINAWLSRRESPGPWADLWGEHISFTLPSACIRDLDGPLQVLKILQLWDKVIASHHHLKGTDIREKRRQWIVYDVQPKRGYMHSGYPIVAKLDHDVSARMDDIENFVLNYDVIRSTGRWGVYHELGHNMQDAVWTFDGTVEVTVNIFTLHAMEVISGANHWIHPWLANQMDRAKIFLETETTTFEDWKRQPGVALAVYAQLIHQFGWGAYKAVFRKYEAMGKNEKRSMKNPEKIDTWIITFSKVTHHNLVPLFDFWKFPISDKVDEALSDMKHFMPDDEFTQLSPHRMAYIYMKYRTLDRNAEQMDDNFDKTIGQSAVPQPYVTVEIAEK